MCRQHRAGPDGVDHTSEVGIGVAQSGHRVPHVRRRQRDGHRDGSGGPWHVPYMPGVNMMCALGVPGNMSQGVPTAATVLSPVDAVVAPGT